MKTTIKNFLMLFALVILASCSSDDDQIIDPVDDDVAQEEEVAIPDPLLSAAIKSELGLDENDDINAEDMLDLKELDVSGLAFAELSDLTGLEYAINLTYLRFGETAVTDLDPISDLENIEYLRFNNTAITDVSALSNYTSLTYFNANTVTGLTDISPLAGITGLQEIILREVPFGNEGMETIRNFTSLYRINMRDTGVTDLSVLGELMAEGALLDSTPGAADAGGADLDLRGLSIANYTPVIPYLDNITTIDGLPENEAVAVPDERLASQIRITLGVDQDIELTTLYMLSLSELNLDGGDD
ncbi:leucine-rich repeat domain-containing protein [Salegentibacter sp. Hel_I_6]|uniref:leucine-rich repeat domain-containing protein n=1 Tax=Salegentibacter sp. Hel_I_6 TaxID=1250278 RepID=UPI0005672FBC|nr:leucine-rich repeat domain-containing protein [Salegentibacter sp. Hel_I_6]